MTEDELKHKLDAILSDKEKKVAHILIEHTLPQMHNYYEQKIQELRKRLLDEKISEINRYVIAITVCDRNRSDLFEGILFPMDMGDLEEPEYAVNSDVLRVPVWISADKEIIRQYQESGVDAAVYVRDFEYAVKFRVTPNHKYLNILAQCRRAFTGNGIYWGEVNDTYLQQFYYLETDLKGMEITGYSLNDPATDENIHRNIIPLWNLKHMSVAAKDFPVMQEDRVCYQYDFTLTDNVELLMDEEESRDGYFVQYPDKISYITQNNNRQYFKMWQIYHRDYEGIDKEYMILTNSRKKQMWSSMEQSHTVHSAFELARCIQSLDMEGRVEYDGYDIRTRYDTDKDYITARLQENAILQCSTGDYLEIKVHNISMPAYLYRGTIQYIVNVVQCEFREYCVICEYQCKV